jgi:hypothetical protein
MVAKATPKGTLDPCIPKKFPPKTNQDPTTYNAFDLQNVFHEDRLNFPVMEKKLNFCPKPKNFA